MKKGFVLAVIAFIVFSFNAVAEEVVLSTSLNGSEYFQDANDNGERISGDARVTIRGNSVSLFSRKGAENAASVKFYLTVGKKAEAIRPYLEGVGSCYIVVVDQKKTTGLSENEAINGPMLPFDGSGSRTLLLRDYPDILIDNNGEYMVEIHIIVANGNKYDLYNIAVDSLVGDDIVVPPRIRRSAPIQRSVLYVLYNGPIIYSDGGCYDDWYIHGSVFWEWRVAYFRTIVAPCYPVFVRNYYPERTVVYFDRVVEHTNNYIFIVRDKDQLCKRNFDRRIPENRYRDMDSRGLAIRRQYEITVDKKSGVKSYKTENRNPQSRHDQVLENVQNNKKNSERTEFLKADARNSRNITERNPERKADGYVEGADGTKQPIYGLDQQVRKSKPKERNNSASGETTGSWISSFLTRKASDAGKKLFVVQPSDGGESTQRAKQYSASRETPQMVDTSQRSEVRSERVAPPAEVQTQVREEPRKTRAETPRQENPSTKKDDEDRDKPVDSSSRKRVRGR